MKSHVNQKTGGKFLFEKVMESFNTKCVFLFSLNSSSFFYSSWSVVAARQLTTGTVIYTFDVAIKQLKNVEYLYLVAKLKTK